MTLWPWASPDEFEHDLREAGIPHTRRGVLWSPGLTEWPTLPNGVEVRGGDQLLRDSNVPLKD